MHYSHAIDSVTDINRRLKRGAEEIEEMKNCNIFNYKVINDDLNVAYQDLKDHILSTYPELNFIVKVHGVRYSISFGFLIAR